MPTSIPSAPTESAGRAAEEKLKADQRAGRNLMIGMLVVFFGLAFSANGLIVYLSSRDPMQVVETYNTEKR